MTTRHEAMNAARRQVAEAVAERRDLQLFTDARGLIRLYDGAAAWAGFDSTGAVRSDRAGRAIAADLRRQIARVEHVAEKVAQCDPEALSAETARLEGLGYDRTAATSQAAAGLVTRAAAEVDAAALDSDPFARMGA